MNWVKLFHILCVMGWMAGVFVVPRALIYWKREHAASRVVGPAAELTIRVYRFSLGLGALAILSGLWLGHMLGWPDWIALKVALVALLAAHYGWSGLLVRRALRGNFPASDLFLRVFNEVSVLVLVGILWVVVFQPG